MELCTTTPSTTSTRAISTTLHHHKRLFSTSNPTHFRFKSSSLLLPQTSLSSSVSGLRHLTSPLVRSTTSQKRSSGAARSYGEERDLVVTLEDVPPREKSVYSDALPTEVPKDESPIDGDDEQTRVFELFDKLNIQIKRRMKKRGDDRNSIVCQSTEPCDVTFESRQVDSADTSSILLLGSGALVSLWFASAIVGAIDAIPVFPKLMEVVGLAYTFWFSTRYLLFKENRDELAAKIEQLKQQVLGSIED